MRLIVCRRKFDAEICKDPATDSREDTCARCRTKILVSPSGQRLMREVTEFALLCNPCAFEAARTVTFSSITQSRYARAAADRSEPAREFIDSVMRLQDVKLENEPPDKGEK